MLRLAGTARNWPGRKRSPTVDPKNVDEGQSGSNNEKRTVQPRFSWKIYELK